MVMSCSLESTSSSEGGKKRRKKYKIQMPKHSSKSDTKSWRSWRFIKKIILEANYEQELTSRCMGTFFPEGAGARTNPMQGILSLPSWAVSCLLSLFIHLIKIRSLFSKKTYIFRYHTTHGQNVWSVTQDTSGMERGMAAGATGPRALISALGRPSRCDLSCSCCSHWVSQCSSSWMVNWCINIDSLLTPNGYLKV